MRQCKMQSSLHFSRSCYALQKSTYITLSSCARLIERTVAYMVDQQGVWPCSTFVWLPTQNKAEQLHSAVFGGDPRKVQRDQERDAHQLRYVQRCTVMISGCCVLSDDWPHTAYVHDQHVDNKCTEYGQSTAQHARQTALAEVCSPCTCSVTRHACQQTLVVQVPW